MSLDDLRAEFEQELIGPRIYGEITAIARRVVRNYDPRVYAHAADWEDGFDDLLQEVVLERLLGEGQLAYAMTVAADLAHWRPSWSARSSGRSPSAASEAWSTTFSDGRT